MIAAFLLAASAPVTALDAETAFARDAKTMGQWSAFRKWADHDAVMFTPQAVWAKTFLKPLKNPPKSIGWHATQSFVSCDGRTAVNTGPWFTQDAKLAGYFTTVWQHTPSGWRWVYDGGVPRLGKGGSGSGPRVRTAACTGHPHGPPIQPPPALSAKQSVTTPQDNGRGQSADGTLGWDWKVSATGARTFRVFLWTNGKYAEVVHAVDPAPKRK